MKKQENRIADAFKAIGLVLYPMQRDEQMRALAASICLIDLKTARNVLESFGKEEAGA